jgi:predicted nucleic acid-binding protein
VSVWELLVQSGGDLIAPSLLHYEVANALYQQQRSGVVSSELAALPLDRCLGLPIELNGDAGLHIRALEIACEHSCERHMTHTMSPSRSALGCRCGHATGGSPLAV